MDDDGWWKCGDSDKNLFLNVLRVFSAVATMSELILSYFLNFIVNSGVLRDFFHSFGKKKIMKKLYLWDER